LKNSDGAISPEPPATNNGRRRRSFWFHLHFWVGWLAAIPLLVICVTGVALAFDPEFHAWEEPEYYALEPNGKRLDLPEALEHFEAALPRLHHNYLQIPESPHSAYMSFATELGENGASNRGLRAFLNPYTSELSRESENTTLIRQLEIWHRTLTFGKIGRWIMGGSSLLMGLSSIAGIILWWPMRGRTFARAWRRGRALDWHNTLGLIALLPLILLSITGITFTWGRFVFPWLDQVQGISSKFEKPVLEHNASVDRDDFTPVPLSSVARQIEENFPAFEIHSLQGSRNPTQPYIFNLREATDLHPGGNLKLIIDPLTGKEVSRFDQRATGPVGWYRRYFYIIHTGHPFPLWARLFWGLFSLTGGVLIVIGIWITIRRWGRTRRKPSPQNQEETL